MFSVDDKEKPVVFFLKRKPKCFVFATHAALNQLLSTHIHTHLLVHLISFHKSEFKC